MFYEDLSKYTYFDDEAFEDSESTGWVCFRPQYTRLNVGWLEADQPYATGSVPGGLTEKLEAVRQVLRVNLCRGYHECGFCFQTAVEEGNGEIRIPGEPGIAYAAPVMITHYITAHSYRPPQAFIDAVLAVDIGAWAATRWPDLPFPGSVTHRASDGEGA